MNNSTRNEIESLISKKRKEGAYWDFKRQHHSDKADLLHDILCMANEMHPGNKYIIIGVENETFEIISISSEKPRTQANITDFLSKIPFAGDIRPEIELQKLVIKEKEIDVIVILDKPEKPYFLSGDYSGKDKKPVRAGVIYTRVGDKNTARNGTADIYHIEKMWRQRFGLDLSVMDRFKVLLKEQENWHHNPVNKYTSFDSSVRKHDNFPVYHKIFPEFRVEFSEWKETSGESFCYFYPNETSYLGQAYFKYHSTIIFELECILCDGMRITLPVPDEFHFDFKDKELECPWFYYYKLDSEKGLFLKFLQGCADVNNGRGSYPRILFFDNDKELQSFIAYAQKNTDEIKLKKPREFPSFKKNLMGRIKPNFSFISKMGQLYDDWL